MSASLTNREHFISLAQAVEMTTTYRDKVEAILKPEYQGKNLLVRSETFDRAPFDKVLAQPGCAGLRLYYGMDGELKVHAIVVGVNEQNEDMLPSSYVSTTSATEAATDSTTTGDGDVEIIELGARCPDECPPPSDLNP